MISKKNNYHINYYVEDIREYRVASHDIWNVEAMQRNKYLKLDWNESTIQPSPSVHDAISKLVSEGNFFNLYPATENSCLTSLIAKYVDIPIDYVQYFASSDSMQEYICHSFLDVNSRVLILSPSYDNFRLTAESCGAEVIYSDMDKNFCFDQHLFEEDIDNYNPGLVYICNPNNPTGIQHSKDYIEHLLNQYPRILFLIDEAYWEFSGITVKDLTKKFNNILICRTFSKAFGLANFRIGYLISNPINIKLINKIRNPKNITTFAQVAAEAALKDVDYMWMYVEEVKKARRYLINELADYREIGRVFESSGNFVMFEFNNEEYKKTVVERLKSNNIFIRELTQRPSVTRCIRISVGNTSQMKCFVEEFNGVLKND